jgi:hypothetical protein
VRVTRRHQHQPDSPPDGPPRLTGSVLNGTTSHQPYDLLTNHRGHDLHLGLNGQELVVLTR